MPQNLKSRPPDRPNVDFGIDFGTLLASFCHIFFDFLIICANHQNAFIHSISVAWTHPNRQRKSATIFCARAAFWGHLADFGRHLADFGRHLGPSWAPRGSQNRPFWPQVAPKTQKMSPRMRHQKMYENLIEIWWKKWRFWMCSSHRTIMYKGILVVGAYYDKIKKLIKKCLGGLFRFLVAFLRFLADFLHALKII